MVLNRQNTMLYFDGDKSIIKTYFKEVSLEMSQEQHKLLLDLLNASKRERLISDFLKEFKDENYVMRLLKVLYEAGSVFIYPVTYNLSRFFRNSWFRVLSQYLPPDKDILHSCCLVEEAIIHITPRVDQEIPNLRELLIDNDLAVSPHIAGEVRDNDWIISMENNFIHQNSIELSLSEDKLVGVIQKDKATRSDIPIIDKEHSLARTSLLYKIGPYYTMLYIVKSIVGISKSAFSINKEGKFYEYDLVAEDFKQTIEEFSFPKPIVSKGILDYVVNFEFFINRNPTIPFNISGWKDESYADLFQMGYATYSLTDSLTKDTFVYAGLDYIETAMSSIKKGLEHYLNKGEKKAKWMVSTQESYYLDKVLLLLQYIDEPYTFHMMERADYPNAEFAEYLNTINVNPDFYLMKFCNSNSYTVYLYDLENDQLYTDGKRSINIADKMAEIALNYILIKNNADKLITNILVPLAAKEKEELFKMASHQDIGLEIPDEKQFIENGLLLIKHSYLDLNESAWKYEEQLNESNLIVREIEVKTYQKPGV